MNKRRILRDTIVLALLSSPSARCQVTQRVSVNSTGEAADSYSIVAAISADGRYVAFRSRATNLSTLDTFGEMQLFLRDRTLGTTELISMSTGGVPANHQVFEASISADGRIVAFSTAATNLVPGVTNTLNHIYVRDRREQKTACLPYAPESSYWYPSISADGRFVAYTRAWVWPHLPAPFVFDRLAGSTTSAGPTGDGGGDEGLWGKACSISGDGRFVGYLTYGNHVVPGDDDGLLDVFVDDRISGTVECASVGSNGPAGGRISTEPSLSHDGRYVAFQSLGANLVPGDTNHSFDIFVRDRRTHTTERVSVDSSGIQGNGDSFGPSISADGRYVAFYSNANDLVSRDTHPTGFKDAYVHDRATGATERVNVGPGGSQVEFGCEGYAPCLSADGRCVAFDSRADRLVPDDTNGWSDVFVRDRFGGTGFATLCDPGAAGVLACPCANAPGGPGRGCDSSAGTGGARLTAEGGTFLSSDSLQFRASGTVPNGLCVLLQGTASMASGAVYGQGVRCVGGSIRRLFAISAVSSSALVPDFSAGEVPISKRSKAMGDEIRSGEQRWYQVIYRDPIVFGGCPASSTFNATQAGVVTWSP